MLRRKDILETENLILNAIEDSDRNDVFSVFENALVAKTYMVPVFIDDEARDKFFSRLKESSKNSERFVFGIYLNSTFIGLLNDVDVEEETVEVGYCLHPNFWNKGYATEALKVAIKELFRMGYKTVIAAHFIENIASGKVMLKNGMHRIDKEEIIKYQGKEHRCIYYAVDNK